MKTSNVLKVKKSVWYILAGFLIMCAVPDRSSEIDQVYETFSEAYTKLDVRLIEDIYDDSAYYLSPDNIILRGKQSFIVGFDNMFEQARLKDDRLSIEFDIDSRNVYDRVAVDIGLYKMTRYSGDSSEISVGKFITVLEYKPNGKWRFVADGYSSAPDSSWTKN